MASQKFFKVINRKKKHYDHEYHDGLNKLNKPFKDKGECIKNGLYFTTLEHIPLYYEFGVWLYEITLPTDNPEFKMCQDPTKTKWRANMIILGKCYSLTDPQTYKDFGLPINIEELVRCFSETKNEQDFKKFIELKILSDSDEYRIFTAFINFHIKFSAEMMKFLVTNRIDFFRKFLKDADFVGHIDFIAKYLQQYGGKLDNIDNMLMCGQLKKLEILFQYGLITPEMCKLEYPDTLFLSNNTKNWLESRNLIQSN